MKDPNARNPYISVKLPDGGTKYAHTLIAERILGRPLTKEEVHHVNENKADNRNENLVICPDRNYHKLLHIRTEALDACGHADWRKCWICKDYSDPASMINRGKNTVSGRYVHKHCDRDYQIERYRKKLQRL